MPDTPEPEPIPVLDALALSASTGQPVDVVR